jgi:TonB family protein
MLVTGLGGSSSAQGQQPLPVYQPGGDVSFPRVVREIRPDYTPEGLRAKVQGEVELESVVLPDGSVGDVRVVKSLDRQFGLDEQAVSAARLWRFEPSLRAGQPVPVRITIVLEFRTGEAPFPSSDAARVAAARTMTLEEFAAGASREGQPGVVAPRVVREVSPSYTLDAFRRGVEGTVGVDVVVMPDGTVSRARVVASLDAQPRGLDDGALGAAFRWRFVPSSGTVSGRPAPVIVRLSLEYKVR